MGFFTSLDFWGKVCAVITFCVSICFVLLTIPYFISIAEEVKRSQDTNTVIGWVSILLWVISILILLCIAFCGIWGSCKQAEKCLCIFFMVNLIDWAFVVIQMIIFYVAYDQCGSGGGIVGPGSPFESVCTSQNDLLLWIPSIILAFINACGAFVSCGLRHKIMQRDDDKGKAMGEYFG